MRYPLKKDSKDKGSNDHIFEKFFLGLSIVSTAVIVLMIVGYIVFMFL
ncbi:hypothetical protein [Paenibacillus eucommiae]|uniref:DUF4044 domain-containing protein n=1 Tax=Paenibacillus eucommiae TaxID=1355755 RepID=A0ABS4IU58_9BACL|nr:hypothetical protein [Paenibacillus eucommiae]MBP1990556.1 hypothetical protein [Paenibacillus eucommiae]